MRRPTELWLTDSVQATIEDAERKNDLSFMKNLSKLGIQLGVVTVARTKIGRASHHILSVGKGFNFYVRVVMCERMW